MNDPSGMECASPSPISHACSEYASQLEYRSPPSLFLSSFLSVHHYLLLSTVCDTFLTIDCGYLSFDLVGTSSRTIEKRSKRACRSTKQLVSANRNVSQMECKADYCCSPCLRGAATTTPNATAVSSSRLL